MTWFTKSPVTFFFLRWSSYLLHCLLARLISNKKGSKKFWETLFPQLVAVFQFLHHSMIGKARARIGEKPLVKPTYFDIFFAHLFILKNMNYLLTCQSQESCLDTLLWKTIILKLHPIWQPHCPACVFRAKQSLEWEV